MSDSSERPDWRSPTVVLACCGAILTVTMGLRHGLGMFLAPVSQGHGWGREVFSFALAVQNLVWGLAQPFTGAIADRFGTTRVIIGGGFLYALGMVLMALSPNGMTLTLSAGVLIGLGLSGTTFGIIFGAINRVFAPARRSKALGIASAAGSFGQFLMLPLSNTLIDHFGWQYALVALSVPSAAASGIVTIRTPSDATKAFRVSKPTLKLLGVLANGVAGYLNHHTQALEAMRAERLPMLGVSIPRTIALANMAALHKPITAYDRTSSAALAFLELNGVIKKWLNKQK